MRHSGRAMVGLRGGLGPRLGRLLNRAAAATGYRLHVAAANLWRDQYNPLRGLTIRRAASLLEEGERGALADVQWTYRYVEMQDATLGALIERRTSAIQQLSWEIKTRDDVPAAKAATAAAQAAALRETYEGIGNLTAALEFLVLASFRGYSHLEKVWQGGRLVELAPIEQWFWVRQGTAGPWLYNAQAKFGVTSGEEVPAGRLVVREVRMPINRVGLIAYVRKGLSQKDWDAYIESYGVPAVFILMPPDVPDGKADEYLTTAEQVAGDARGVLPNGADIKTVDAGARGNNPFLEHIRYQDEQVVLRGTGGLLTMLNEATGIGSGQSESHQNTFEAIARAEAAEISELLRRTIDLEVLARATPGEPAWAYFELAAREEMDTTAVVRDVAILARAGFQVSAEWVKEKTGYELAPAAPAPELPPLRNRAEEPEEGALAKLLRAALATDLHGAGEGLAESMQEELAEAVAEEVEGDEPIHNSGTREGAIRGWETRRRSGWQARPDASAEELSELVDGALDNTEDNTDRIEFYGTVTDEEADILGLGRGYRRGLSRHAIRHMIDSHGDPKVEEPRGQIAVTREDIKRIPETIARSNHAERAGMKNNVETIRYYLDDPAGGTTTVLDEQRTKHNRLIPVQLIKFRKSGMRLPNAPKKKGRGDTASQ
jgi:phage gp29-like protein